MTFYPDKFRNSYKWPEPRKNLLRIIFTQVLALKLDGAGSLCLPWTQLDVYAAEILTGQISGYL
jgi:hypothetical protein